VTDIGWIDRALTAARPQAMAALLRYFRDLETAEEAFQEACLRALKTWPDNGPPRDPTAWLIFVGRNAALDQVRRHARQTGLPDEAQLSDLDDAEDAMAQRLDDSQFRDDILRLMFVCCDPALPASQQIALSLRIVSGLTVSEIARAFLSSEAAIEQRITRAKRRIAEAEVPFAPPGPVERAERLMTVASMIYLLFNEGYSATGGSAHVRVPLCDEAIRLARLLLQLFPAEPELMGLTALLLLQHSRAAARLDADGAIVLLDDQDRKRWDAKAIAEGSALIEKAARHGAPGPYQLQAAIAAAHARARHPQDTDWCDIERLYAALDALQPSPVVALNHAVAVSKVSGPADALAMLDHLEKPLLNYFYFHVVKGALLMQLGRCTEAKTAFDHAIARATSATEAAHIRLQIDRLVAAGRAHP
jgi:RNA polymerase sigma-70 factor (ECF subfamily)